MAADDENDKTLLGSIPHAEPHIVQMQIDTLTASKHYSAVGRVASEWAGFEHEIQFIICKLANLDFKIGACITSNIGSSGRLMDALIAIIELKGTNKETLKNLRTFAEKVGRKQRKRNRFVHDSWFFERHEDKQLRPYRMELSASKTLVYEATEEDTIALHNFANEIRCLGSELQTIISPP